jgi:hypothetical protein
MARKKSETEAGETAAAATPTVTKADAVRAALAEGADSPAEGIAFIKAKFGIDITPAHFSSYKSQQKAKAGKPAGRRGRAPRAEAAAAPLPPSGLNGPAGLATSVEAIKVLVDQYGVDQVVGIARLFGK